MAGYYWIKATFVLRVALRIRDALDATFEDLWLDLIDNGDDPKNATVVSAQAMHSRHYLLSLCLASSVSKDRIIGCRRLVLVPLLPFAHDARGLENDHRVSESDANGQENHWGWFSQTNLVGRLFRIFMEAPALVDNDRCVHSVGTDFCAASFFVREMPLAGPSPPTGGLTSHTARSDCTGVQCRT